MMIRRALALLAVDPLGLGGALMHGPSGPRREALLTEFGALLPAGMPRRRIPVNITVDRLHGGLDLAATLARGTPVYEAGLLACARGGVVTLPMAERASTMAVTGLLGALDGAEEGQRSAVVALDESLPEEPGIPAAIRERLAFVLELDRLDETPGDDWPAVETVASARERLGAVRTEERDLLRLCQAAIALGAGSSRAELLALRAARCHAALEGREAVSDRDLEVAAALVLGPRATQIPAPPTEDPPPPEPPSPDRSKSETEGRDQELQELPDRILAAVTAALPANVLAMLNPRRAGQGSGRGGPSGKTLTHGRRIGARPGDPRRGARLDVVETLRAAAPWQRLRIRAPGRVAVRKDDFRVQRLLHRTGATVIVAVDASGSSALFRLAEAKGAVELLLAESYVRRDRVALISFRGSRAELILPPTRSLARARRHLAGLPGGGGTPLAAAIAEGERLALQVARERNGGPILFALLTDARANVALDGTGGRPRAEADALTAARSLRMAGVPAILIDTGPRPSAFAGQVAASMGGTYLPLPVADAHQVSAAVRGLSAALERSA
jgi:magnesium chelatase subunit D